MSADFRRWGACARTPASRIRPRCMLLAPRGGRYWLVGSSMEEHNSSLTPQESVAALSASALRELQQRAQSTLASSRDQAARLEAEINQQLDAIAATLSEQTALD